MDEDGPSGDEGALRNDPREPDDRRRPVQSHFVRGTTSVATTLFAGLVLGSIYILVGLGYNVVLIASGAFNFAQAAVVMLGTFLASALAVEAGYPNIVAVLLCGLAGALVGVAIEFVAIRPVVGKGQHGELVTTIGASTVLTGLVV